ncbi:PREDICTED: vitamin K-dependent protein Z isoform X2 [Chinchilla lanigera]|uniref:vitamin K-dependent protein Z isoform X2 n=1 Tax=Chinchilla lanigera TaxID=34839 RepID=UPI000696B197|nr:PREDICTED: vitamin K-dependent protein Z isoform X2 [Chinchilla lanigera]
MAGRVPLLQGLVLLLLSHQAELSVFIPASSANQVLLRWKRAGSYILEELFEGNLEKECYEEICVHEEAREVFEDDAATGAFWREYRGGSPCISQPCLNNGSCHDTIRSFTCTCSPGFEGRTCALAKNRCHPERPDGCQHFCHPGEASYTCSCAEGHKLGKDRRSCAPHEQCACGVLTSQHGKTADSSRLHLPHFPWQVKLTDSQGKGFCSGVLIQERFILTTAQCSLSHRNISVKSSPAGPGEAPWTARVRRAHVHTHYDAESGQNDISLLELERPVRCPGSGLPVCTPERDFAEQVLVPGTVGVLSGWTINGTNLGDMLMTLPVTQVDGEECDRALNVTVTTRMCCERGRTVAGPWAAGSVVTREHKGTWFLTGILGSSPPAQPQAATFLVIKVSRYTLWFKQTMR